MKTWIKFILLGVASMLSLLPLHATTVTGTFKYNGTPFTGYFTYQLSYPASSGTYINLPVSSAPVYVSNGQFASLALDGNDTLLPRGTYYAFTLSDMYGNSIARLNYSITGSTFDLGAAVPTPVLTNNVSFLDLLGIRNFSALNSTFTNQIQIGTGSILSALGLSNAKLVGNIAFAQAYAAQAVSTTCGISEAQSALPSSGGIIILQQGVCNLTTSLTIFKPITLVGFGSGGYADSSTFTTFTSGTTLVESTSGSTIFVSPSTGTTLSGVHFRGFAITGPSTLDSAVILGSSSSTASYLRNVELDDILVYKSGTNGVEVVGNLSSLYIHNSSFNNNTGSGILLDPSSSFAVSTLHLGPHLSCLYNGNSGIVIDSPAIQNVRLQSSNLDHNTSRGLYVTSSSTSASVHAYQSSFSQNGESGVNLDGGFGHTLQDSSFTSGSIQQYGVRLTSTSSPGLQTASISNNLFTSNSVADFYVGASVPYALVYPQISQSAATYTVSAWSISAGTASLTVSGNSTIINSSPITVSNTNGFSGCTNFNGPHTAVSASSTTITFSTTCTGSGSSGYVASGSMTIASQSATNIHYISPASTVTDQYATVSGCTFANDGGGISCSPSNLVWPQPFVDSSYTASCAINFSSGITGGSSTQPSIILNWSVASSSQLSITEGVSQGSSGGFLVSSSYGVTVVCHGHHL